MYLGRRRIRSAGRTSGSIEITLPAQLQVLEGVECSLMVREGSRPEIVMHLDLSAAQALFHELWQKLRLGLEDIGEIGDFSPGNFTLALFPPIHWQDRPPLSYADALAVVRQRAAQQRDNDLEALPRLMTFLAVGAGYRLGLRGSLALAFGDAVAYVTTGTSTGLGTDFERGMAHRIFWGEDSVQRPLESPFDDRLWQGVQSDLRRIYDQFRTWQDCPEAYAPAREKWYRALTVEIGGQVSSMDDYLEQNLLGPGRRPSAGGAQRT